MVNNRIKNSFTLQAGPSDCGTACLKTVIKYFGGEASLEELRLQSGTTQQGTTLAGLKMAAAHFGLTARGFMADGMHRLRELTSPAILHVQLSTGQFHYMVLFKSVGKDWLVGDPAQGIKLLSNDELKNLWKSKTLLIFSSSKGTAATTTKSGSWFVSLIKKDLQLLAAALILGSVIGILSLAQAVFTQQLIDIYLPQKKGSIIATVVILFLLLLAFRALLNFLRNHLLLDYHVKFCKSIVHGFFNKLYKLPAVFFDTRNTGEITARINDTDRITKVIQLLTGAFIIDLLMSIVLLVAIGWYSLHLMTGTLAVVIILIAVLISFNKPILTSHKKLMQAYAFRENIFIETIASMNSIKSYNVQNEFAQRSFSGHETYQDQVLKLGKLNLKCGLISELLGVVLLLIPLYVGSVFVLNEELLLGEMIAVLFLTSGMLPAIGRLVIFNTQIKEARVAFQRIHDFWTLSGELSSSADTVTSKIKSLELNNLGFTFPGGVPILQGVSFRLLPNAINTLKGKSGSGKTTLLNILQKLYVNSSGIVMANGIDIKKWSTPDWRRRLGIVPQNCQIFQLSMAQNISLNFTDGIERQVESFCRNLGFHRYFSEFSNSYEINLGPMGQKLSGGQAQLLAWARALYRKPQILLLDEPTTFLDAEKKEFVLSLLQRLKSQILILMVTHDQSLLDKADQVIDLD